MNYYERHIGDYLKDTAHLSLLHHGVYARLLDVYYTREQGFVEGEAHRLIGARTKEERAATDEVLAEFFVLKDGVWAQGRCDEEIARYRDKQEKAKRSADARWAASGRNANASASGDAPAMRSHSDGNAPSLQTPDTTPTEKPPSGVQGEGKPKPSKRCPDAFAVDAELVGWAKANAPGVDIPRETVKFRNHTFGTARQDWPATWRNWMLEAADRKQQRGAAVDQGFGFETPADRAKRERIAELTGGLASRKPTAPPGPPGPSGPTLETIDVPARLIG